MTRIDQWDQLVDHTLVGREDWDELPSGPVVVIVEFGRPSVESSGPDQEG